MTAKSSKPIRRTRRRARTHAHQPPIERLLAVMARLRDPASGCLWDREQTFATIAPYTIEEAYEVAEAAERGVVPELKEELGDLLLQVAFHARMAEERGAFDFDDVAAAIADKMVRRHPHVFGTARVDTAAAQTLAWEEQKAHERRAKAATRGEAPSALDGVGVAFPALTRALKLQRRAARVGFDWPAAAPIYDKIAEEIDELKAESGDPLRSEDELGDVLFAVVNLARWLQIDPEQALRRACRKFERRFRQIEVRLAARGIEPAAVGLEALEAEWQAVKAEET
jgi:ATP diphosphatase